MLSILALNPTTCQMVISLAQLFSVVSMAYLLESLLSIPSASLPGTDLFLDLRLSHPGMLGIILD